MLYTIKRSIKYLYQKLRYGICDKDVWNVDIYFAEHMVKALKAFERMKRHGYPIWAVDFCDCEEPGSIYESECYYLWEAIIWRLILGFERIVNQFNEIEDDIEYDADTMELFINVYYSLWD